MAFYAPNLFDLAGGRRQARRGSSPSGSWSGTLHKDPEAEPRNATIPVEWASKNPFRSFLEDPRPLFVAQSR